MSKTPWRELNVEQMAYWDAAPRRSLLALLALLVLALAGFYVLMPKYITWQQTRAQTVLLQEQYTQALQSAVRTRILYDTQNAQTVQVLNQTQLSAWMAHLAVDAHEHGLADVAIKPIELNNQNADKKSQEPSVGLITIKAEGPYNELVQWWAQLSRDPLVLSMDHADLSGVGNNRVRAQVQVTYAQEVQP